MRQYLAQTVQVLLLKQQRTKKPISQWEKISERIAERYLGIESEDLRAKMS